MRFSTRLSSSVRVLMLFGSGSLLFGQLSPQGTPHYNELIRDPLAISTLQQAFAALQQSESTPITDYTLEGYVDSEKELASHGLVKIQGIGNHYGSANLTLRDGTYGFAFHDEKANSAKPGRESSKQPASIAFESSPYFFIPLLQDAISNPSVGLHYINGPSDNQPDIVIRIEKRDGHWRPNYDYALTGFLEFYINPTTMLVEAIQNDARTADHIFVTTRHYLGFSGYSVEDGWLVPHTITETYRNGQSLTITLTSFSFNQHLQASQFGIE